MRARHLRHRRSTHETNRHGTVATIGRGVLAVARRSGSRPAVTDVVWDADGATRAVRRARDPPRGERGRSEDADDRGRLKRGKRRPKPMGASSVRDERGTDAPADLRPRLCGSSSSATPCLRGGAPSRPLDEALGHRPSQIPTTRSFIPRCRAMASPGVHACIDRAPCRAFAAEDSARGSVRRGRRPSLAFASRARPARRPRRTRQSRATADSVVLSEATTGLETGTAVRRTAFSNGSPRGTTPEPALRIDLQTCARFASSLGTEIRI